MSETNNQEPVNSESGDQPSTASSPLSSESKNIAVLTHVGALVFWFIPSLVVYLAVNNREVKPHAKEALNFTLSHTLWGVALAAVLGIITVATMGFGSILTIPVWLAFMLYVLVVIIKAAIAANNGEVYRYPLTIRMIS